MVLFLTRMGLASQSEWNTSDESDCQEFGDLFTYGHAPLIVKVTQALLSGL